MGWENIRKNIAKGELIQSGGILKGSAFYLFPTKNADDLKEIYKSMSLVVYDFRGNSSEVPIKYPIEENDGQLKSFLHTRKPARTKLNLARSRKNRPDYPLCASLIYFNVLSKLATVALVASLQRSQKTSISRNSHFLYILFDAFSKMRV